MCFEVILPIVLAGFSIFGLYALLVYIGDTWFGSENISVCLEVDTKEVADHLDVYLKEALRKPISRSGGVVVLVRREYASEFLLRRLARRNLRYYIIDYGK